MKKTLIYTLLPAAMLYLSACEKVVNIDLPAGAPLPYIDAWITDQPGVQTIRFLDAANYLDSSQPKPISGATIVLTDITASQTYAFTYSNGSYTYNGGTAGIGVVNHIYKLGILYNGQQFEATDTMKRNTVIDSIPVEYKKGQTGEKEGYYAKLYATDIAGAPDYYWIRTYKNGAINYNVPDMFSIDGAFTEGLTDGFLFIPPFRDGITSRDHPYVKGDVVRVVLRSLSHDSHDFWFRASQQLQNGGLFAKVLENVPANMKNTQTGGKDKIYGWFGMTAQNEQSKLIQ
ncbi:MAG: DUF4249 domain-containing protein [Bacteroidetes bacterium]|nr:DUF4249 domain-containing protein [Bacteroidota bacterium]